MENTPCKEYLSTSYLNALYRIQSDLPQLFCDAMKDYTQKNQIKHPTLKALTNHYVKNNTLAFDGIFCNLDYARSLRNELTNALQIKRPAGLSDQQIAGYTEEFVHDLLNHVAPEIRLRLDSYSGSGSHQRRRTELECFAFALGSYVKENLEQYRNIPVLSDSL